MSDEHELLYKPSPGVTWSPADILARIERVEAYEEAHRHQPMLERIAALEVRSAQLTSALDNVLAWQDERRDTIAALEAQVRELQGHRHGFTGGGTGVPAQWNGKRWEAIVDNGDNAPPKTQLKIGYRDD